MGKGMPLVKMFRKDKEKYICAECFSVYHPTLFRDVCATIIGRMGVIINAKDATFVRPVFGGGSGGGGQGAAPDKDGGGDKKKKKKRTGSKEKTKKDKKRSGSKEGKKKKEKGSGSSGSSSSSSGSGSDSTEFLWKLSSKIGFDII